MRYDYICEPFERVQRPGRSDRPDRHSREKAVTKLAGAPLNFYSFSSQKRKEASKCGDLEITPASRSFLFLQCRRRSTTKAPLQTSRQPSLVVRPASDRTHRGTIRPQNPTANMTAVG